MKRSSTVIWNSSLVVGRTWLSTGESFGLHEFPGSRERLDSSTETACPEQLLAAAHEGCLSMMLSNALAPGGGSPEKLMVAANLVLDNISVNGWSITSSHFVFIGKIPEAKITAIQEIAAESRDDPPFSHLVDGSNVDVNEHRSY